MQTVYVPRWQSLPWLVHGFSTRTGGVTRALRTDRATGELNLGASKSDTAANVARNRRLFLDELGASRMKLTTLRQIHSGVVREVLAAQKEPLRGDGMHTEKAGVLLGIQTADCVPVLLVDPENRVVAAFHAGWRGTVKRIAERGVGTMRMRYGSRPEKLLAALGPCIGACCYSVGEEVVAEFASQFRYSAELFREVYDLDPVKQKYPMLFLTARAPGHSNLGPQTHLDLVEANRRQLLDAGLKKKNIWTSGECTACNPDKYFSHRGEHGFTGRMMAVVGIR
jgi:polyphenol oxidase